jgi:hypothetical protein
MNLAAITTSDRRVASNAATDHRVPWWILLLTL